MPPLKSKPRLSPRNANENTDVDLYFLMSDGISTEEGVEANSALRFNPSTDTVTVGALSTTGGLLEVAAGNVVENVVDIGFYGAYDNSTFTSSSVSSVLITNGGSGYTSAPTVSFSGATRCFVITIP